MAFAQMEGRPTLIPTPRSVFSFSLEYLLLICAVSCTEFGYAFFFHFCTFTVVATGHHIRQYDTYDDDP